MSELMIPAPSKRQKLFLQSRGKIVAFGGARGGGKSWAVRIKAVLLCLRYAGIKAMIVRKTYPELQENHILPLCDMLKCGVPDRMERIASYNDSKKHILFPNGSRILFRYCDTDKDTQRFQGTEVDVLFVDEATQQTEEVVRKLTACVRGTGEFPRRIYYTCNPGGPGHGWVKRLFIDRKYVDGEKPEDYEFIQSLVTDNRALMERDPGYLTRLQALPPKLRKAWLEGDWNIFEGQFFEEFRETPDFALCEKAGITQEEAVAQRRYTHVIPAFDLSAGPCRGWNIMRSYDFGYHKPFSLAYWAVDYDGVLYRILEVYGCTQTPNDGVKWSPDEQFKRISEFEREHPWLKGKKIVDSIADPSIWDKSRGESTADVAAKYGIYFTPGDNHRIPGWMQVHYRMQFDENGYPRMYIFDTCKAFIRTMPLMVYSDTKPEDLNTDLEDHVADEVRYMCMSRPIEPIILKKREPIISDPLNQFTEAQKKRGWK